MNKVYKKNKRKAVKFESLSPDNVIGKLRPEDVSIFLKRYKRVGGIKASYLMDFLTRLDEGDVIGIYIDRKNRLVPLHSNGWCLAPRVNIDKKDGMDSDLLLEGAF